MNVIGLTGSIGMGKSTTAQMFRDLGIPVYDADAEVHALYRGEAAAVVEALFPGTTQDGVVDRTELSKRVLADHSALGRLEAAIHPLLRSREQKFLADARASHAPFAILDIPLFYETGGEDRVDAVIVVTADPEEQQRRVLARPGMTIEKFRAILARQIPDATKRQRADFVIHTGGGMQDARKQVQNIVEQIGSGSWRPAKSPRLT
jgi:dephospho-CoA kinase